MQLSNNAQNALFGIPVLFILYRQLDAESNVSRKHIVPIAVLCFLPTLICYSFTFSHNFRLPWFWHCSPTVWNSLCSGICSSTLARAFCLLLKSHCFQQAGSGSTAPPSVSAKYLRFGHWLTLCTANIVFTLLSYWFAVITAMCKVLEHCVLLCRHATTEWGWYWLTDALWWS